MSEHIGDVNKKVPMTDHAQPSRVFKTTVTGIGPWCVEFPDGEIITTHTEERAHLIANATQAHAHGRHECDWAGPIPLPKEAQQARGSSGGAANHVAQS